MSLCYDFEKWTIISLASIALTLTIQQLMVRRLPSPLLPEQEPIEPHQLQCSGLIIFITKPYKK